MMTQYLSRRNVLAAGGAAVATGLAAAAYKFTGPGGLVVEGRSRARAVRTLASPPAAADVVIIGGGIIGAATAFELAKRGVSVVLCEKGAIAGEASGRSVGQITSSGLDPVKMELLNRAKTLWTGYNAAIQGETGFRQNGYLVVLRDRTDEDYWTKWLESVHGLAPQARLIGRREMASLATLDGNWAAGFVDPSNGCAEPTLAAPAIATAAARLGAKLVAPCAVRSIETTAGRISGVVTERGTIKTSSVVLAGGCWSSLFAGNIGLRLPTLNVFSMCRTVGNVRGPAGSGDLPTATWRQQIDGNYTISVIGGVTPIVPAMARYGWDFRKAYFDAEWDLHLKLGSYFLDQMRQKTHWNPDEISPFEELRILQPSINTPIAEQAVRTIRESLPAFRNMRLGELWSGALVATPDNMPTMSAVGTHPGLYLASGFTYGLTMGPAAGEAMAQLVTGQKTTIDLKPYRYERYVDGSDLRFAA